MPLGTAVGLDPGDIVLDGDPAPQGDTAPNLRPMHVYCGHCRPSQLLLSSCLFVYEIFREPLNGFALNSQGRRVSSLAWTSLKVKVTTDKNGPFGSLRAVYVW